MYQYDKEGLCKEERNEGLQRNEQRRIVERVEEKEEEEEGMKHVSSWKRQKEGSEVALSIIGD